jgi:hypothetical protein
MKQLASFAQKALNDPRLTYQAWTDTTIVKAVAANTHCCCDITIPPEG